MNYNQITKEEAFTYEAIERIQDELFEGNADIITLQPRNGLTEASLIDAGVNALAKTEEGLIGISLDIVQTEQPKTDKVIEVRPGLIQEPPPFEIIQPGIMSRAYFNPKDELISLLALDVNILESYLSGEKEKNEELIPFGNLVDFHEEQEGDEGKLLYFDK